MIGTVLLSALVPERALAQKKTGGNGGGITVTPYVLGQDTIPPTVTITPFGGTFTSPTVNVTIGWCDNSSLVSTSVSITLDGAAQTGSYATGTKTGCTKYATSTLTITLAAGSHTLYASIQDAAGNTGSQSAAFSYTPYRVTVGGDSGTVTRGPNVSSATTFAVSNAGTLGATYKLSVGCANAAFAQCSAPDTVYLGAGQGTHVTVTYTTGTSVTSGSLSLTAKAKPDTTETSTGSSSVNVVAAVYGVTLTADSASITPSSRTDGVQVYRVTNTGNTPTAYNLALTCPTSLFVNCSAPTVVQVANGKTVAVSVGYTTAVGAANGSLSLQATAQPDGAKSASASINVGLQAPAFAVDATPLGWSTLERSQCLTIAVAASVASQCDGLRIAHPLPSVTTYGKTRTPTLLYAREWIHGMGVAVNVTIPSTEAIPDTVLLTVYRRQPDSSLVLSGTSRFPWGVLGFDRGTRRLARAWVGNSTGVIRYHVDVQFKNGANQPVTKASLDGEDLEVWRRASHFGSGWWLAGVEQLVFSQGWATAPDDQIEWIGGDGSVRKYVRQSGSSTLFLSVTPVNGPDSLIKNVNALSTDTAWVRLAGNNVRIYFDNSGQHTRTVNRSGQMTLFGWNGLSSLQLNSITVPGGLSYSFVYDASGWLDTVKAPGPVANRLTTLSREVVSGGATAGIRSIADPDLSAVTFDYESWDSTAAIGGRNDRRGVHTTLSGEGWGPGLNTASTGLGGGQTVVHVLRNAGNIAMDPSGQGPGAALSVAIDSVYTRYTDPRGYVTRFWVNALGAPTKIINALGQTTLIRYTDSRFPGLATETVAPSGLVTRAWYNARGLVDSTETFNPYGDGRSAATTYSWNPNWETVTGVHRPSGAADSTYVDPLTGNVTWQQDGRGAVSRVNYFYDTQNRVVAVQAPGNSSSQMDSIFYDGTLGNVARTKSALGFTAWTYKDGIGRDTLTVSPIDSAQQLTDSVWTHYNAAGEVDSTKTIGPAVQYTMRVFASQGSWSAPLHRDTVVVLSGYDPEGHVTSVNTNVTPADPNSDLLLREGYSYDSLGRQTLHYRTHGSSETTTYDAAGNVLSFTRPSGTVTSTYDALNRVLTRITPSRRYARQRCEGFPPSPITPDSTGNPAQCFEVYPAFPTDADTGYTIAADTARFTYDPVTGAMLTADNTYAKVHRGYYPNGALKGDTVIFRPGPATYDGSGNSTGPEWSASPSGSYAIGLQYDLDGRRTVLTTPFSGILSYGYRSDNGALLSITDATGNWIRYTYDPASRLDSLVFGASGGANSIWETHVYDADGRQTRRIRRTNATTLFDESFWFDAQGRPTKVGRSTAANSAPADTTYLTYAGLGAVQSRERIDQNSNWESEEYRVDGIGNVLQSRNGISTSGGAQDPRASQYGFRGDLQSRLTTDTTHEHESFYQWFDGDRNVVQRFDLVRNSTSNAYTSDVQSRSYYDAANRLRATQVYNVVGSTSSGTFDEMFYDALGRRVVTSSRRNLNVPACTGITFCTHPLCNTSDCGSTLTFTIWDGSQVLAEDRADLGGGSSSYDVGRVTYVHGGGMDQPVAVLDSRLTAGMRVPHATWRGQYESSSTAGGAAADCSLGGGTCEYIRWNAAGAIYARPMAGPLSGGFSYTFAGTLLLDQQDASGLLYRRNRYYDPSSGRFTQEDPAGLAGGLNSYGFAAGDPVNYSDPYGLCPVCVVVLGEMLEGGVTGAIDGALTQMAVNKLRGRPTFDGVAKSAAIGGAVGAVTAGVGSALRMANALKLAKTATGATEAEVASEAEANAVVEQHAGENARPIRDRKTGQEVGVRDDATGNQGRWAKADKSNPAVHANVQNANGGNVHVYVKPNTTQPWTGNP